MQTLLHRSLNRPLLPAMRDRCFGTCSICSKRQCDLEAGHTGSHNCGWHNWSIHLVLLHSYATGSASPYKGDCQARCPKCGRQCQGELGHTDFHFCGEDHRW
jgi:hypothetical protein